MHWTDIGEGLVFALKGIIPGCKVGAFEEIRERTRTTTGPLSSG